MVDLKKPDKTKHEYVIGIDFGHGETSAAICEVEWDKPAGQRENKPEDIDLDDTPNKYAIPSAICRVGGRPEIGDKAFRHMTTKDGIRIGFKKVPQSLQGDDEQLMVSFMKEVYATIREKQKYKVRNGKDDNHIVYIARPSGWDDKSVKNLYCQMASEAAGIPIAGLMSESRAALFYARANNKFAKEISHGVIVLDLGSGTLDFTYFSEDDNETIDHGYTTLGASNVDEVIFNEKILPQVKDFLDGHEMYTDALLFKARKFKEEAYRRKDSTNKVTQSFCLKDLTADDVASMGEYGDLSVKLKVNNIDELNELIQSVAQYQTHLGEAMDDFKNNHIPNKKIYGVFLTGGASRMNFIKELVAEHFKVSPEKVICDDNPSLTVSRGIALLGAMDAITEELVLKLKSELPMMINNNCSSTKLIDMLSSDISCAIWEEIERVAKEWVKKGQKAKKKDLKEELNKALQKFQTIKMRHIANECLKKFVQESDKDIRKEMNEIISNYAPGQEVVFSKKVSMSETSSLDNALNGIIDTIMPEEESLIAGLFGRALGAGLGAALGILLGILSPFIGVAAVGGVVIYPLLKSDETKRQSYVDKLLKQKKENTISDISRKIRENVNKRNLESSVQSILRKYFEEQFEYNLNKVKIPIE